MYWSGMRIPLGPDEGPTNTWDCKCGLNVARYRGESTVECDCGAVYNAAGQRYRDDWASNPSNFDENIGDVEGMEIAASLRDF